MAASFSAPVTVLVDVLAWGAIHASTGYFVHRLSTERFRADNRLTRPRAIERGGALYTETFRIRRWKRLLPEAGALFAGGFDKKRLGGRDPLRLERYMAETRRAELGHVLALLAAPAFFAWNPWPVGVFMLAYAIIANGPCIAAQRYNRLRIQRVLLLRGAPSRPDPRPAA